MPYAELDAPTEVISPASPRRRRRPVKLLVGVVAAMVAGGSATAAVVRHRGVAASPPKAAVAAETVRIERRDLSTTRTLTGRVGYGAPAPLAGHQTATVTWLPPPGVTIKRGQQLYRADDRPVVLFYGALPLYRAIKGRNLIGRDVRIVAENLSALGYAIGRQPGPGEHIAQSGGAAHAGTATAGKEATAAPVRVGPGDGVLTPALTGAIRRWQRDHELPVTGTVTVGEVEVQPGAVRVDSVAVQLGSPSEAALMSVTSTRKVITVDAELADATGISRGDKVIVQLPDDRTVPARVTAVGRDLTPAEGGADAAPELAVTVTANSAKSLAALDSGDVKVRFTGRTVKGALVVPVEALVALAEGGYAIQDPVGLVPVKTGMFADGRVEIQGEGLTEGMAVLVAS